MPFYKGLFHAITYVYISYPLLIVDNVNKVDNLEE